MRSPILQVDAPAIALAGNTLKVTEFPVGMKEARLGKVEIQLTDIAGATSVTWYLCRKSNGDEPCTPATTVSIVAGVTAGTGSVCEFYDFEPWKQDDADDGLFIAMTTNIGATATAAPRLVGTWP